MSDVVDEIFREEEKLKAEPENTKKKTPKQNGNSSISYTNIALTIIILLLCIIAIKPNPKPHPTVGDFMAIKDLGTDEEKREAHRKLIGRLPLVRVESGRVRVDGGDIDVRGEVSIVR